MVFVMIRNDSLDTLVKMIAKLPGLGPKSAQRIVFYLIKNRECMMWPLSESLKKIADSLVDCSICHNIDIINPCAICINPNRLEDVICVIESINDLQAIEKSGVFLGKYHVLGGALSAINGKMREHLNIETLRARVIRDKITEVIIATNSTLEGQTTSFYLSDILKDVVKKITRLAHGIPIGSELEYIDESTLNLALKMRRNFDE